MFQNVSVPASSVPGIPSIAFDGFRSFNESAESVLFFARRGGQTFRCHLTRRALIVYFGAPDCHHDGAHDVGHDVSQDCLHAYDQNTTFIQSVARGLIEHNAQPRNGVIAITANVVFRHITSRQESPE